jgi:hypothetical protein
MPTRQEWDELGEDVHMNLIPTTYGELKMLIARTPRGDWPSRVNKSLTRSQALDILSAAANLHSDDESLVDHGRGGLFLRNVLRECRSRS